MPRFSDQGGGAILLKGASVHTYGLHTTSSEVVAGDARLRSCFSYAKIEFFLLPPKNGNPWYS